MKSEFLEPEGEFVVFGDPKQNVYSRQLDSNGDVRIGVVGGPWNKELTTSRRFTNPRLASLATSFQSSFFQNQVSDTIKTEPADTDTLNFQIVNYVDAKLSKSELF